MIAGKRIYFPVLLLFQFYIREKPATVLYELFSLVISVGAKECLAHSHEIHQKNSALHECGFVEHFEDARMR